MDRGKRSINFLGTSDKKMYMDLKEIVREHVLLFLPAKSLFKFQIVSRDWNLYISSPFFAHNQSLRVKMVSGFFCQSSTRGLSFLSTDPVTCNVPDPTLKFLPVDFEIRASCNGLICCQACNGDKCYYICNPVTKQFKKLPKSSADHGHDPPVVMIFEPSVLNFAAEFKLVCAFPSVDFDDAIEFDIYSSNDNSWTVSAEICFASKKLASKSGVYADGVIYWRAECHGLVAFDLKKERTRLIPAYHGFNSAMGSISGKLCAAFMNGTLVTVNELSDAYTNTMEMHSNKQGWKKKLSFTLDVSLCGSDHVRGSDYMVVLYVGGDLILIQAGNSFICYDMKTKESKVVCSEAGVCTRLFPYVNSLALI